MYNISRPNARIQHPSTHPCAVLASFSNGGGNSHLLKVISDVETWDTDREGQRVRLKTRGWRLKWVENGPLWVIILFAQDENFKTYRLNNNNTCIAQGKSCEASDFPFTIFQTVFYAPEVRADKGSISEQPVNCTMPLIFSLSFLRQCSQNGRWWF